MTSAISQRPVTDGELASLESKLYPGPFERFPPIQRLFFQALLSDPDLDYRKAAEAVGVKTARAKRWIDQPDVQQAVNHLLERRVKLLGINKEEVLLKIVDLLDMAVGEKPIHRVAYDAKAGEFVEQDVHETDLSAAARFTDQLGKHLGMFGRDEGVGLQVNLQLNLGGSAPVDVTPTNPTVEQVADAGS